MSSTRLVFRIVLALVICVPLLAEAGNPPHLILRTPTYGAPHHATPPTASTVVVTAQPYAYGWFGAQPKRHWSRHFGYYRTFTEWSGK